MVQSYSDGINTYIDSMEVNPAKFLPFEFVSIFTMERWSVSKTVAVIQLLTRRFGQAGGEELDRLQELQTNGQAWFDENRPINDFNAPTTIINSSGISIESGNWHYSGMRVRDEVISSIKENRLVLRSRADDLGLPLKFGSFAVLISQAKSATGEVMLLGAPHFPPPPTAITTNITHEVELISPSFHVGGMTVAECSTITRRPPAKESVPST